MNTLIAQTHERLHELIYSEDRKDHYALAAAFCRLGQSVCDQITMAEAAGEDTIVHKIKLGFVLDVLRRFDGA